MRRRWPRIAGPSPIRADRWAGWCRTGRIFWGIWKFARNKTAAKELIEYLSQREQVEQLAAPVSGYDIPPFQSMTDLSVWSDVEPPKGTIYNYPVRPWHDAEYYVPGSVRPSRDRGADLEPLSGPGHGGTTADRTVDQAGARLGQGGAGRLRPLRPVGRRKLASDH